MKRLDHPHLIKLYEIIDDPCSEKLYLVMPVADYGECIEWDPSYDHYAAIGWGSTNVSGSHASPGDIASKTKEPAKPFHFHPNHRL